MDIYHPDTPAISKSGLDKIESSPLDYWWHFLRPERPEYIPDDKQIFETAFRCAVTTPKIFESSYVRQPKVFDLRKPIEKSEFLAVKSAAESKGQIILGYDRKGNNLYDLIIGMQKAVLDHPTTQRLFSGGQIGMPARFQEENTGAVVKFQPHWMIGDVIVNLMSVSDATEEKFQKDAFDQKLHKKAAIQMDGLKMNGFVFVNVEREAPHKIGIYILDDRAVLFGRDIYIANCQTYVQCLESGIWHGLTEKITASSLPDWAYRNR